MNQTRDAHGLGVFVLVFSVAACTAEKRDCPEFDEAERYFNQVAAETVDPEFKDPAFVPVAERFEAIPSDCKRYDRAQAQAHMLRESQQAGRADEARSRALETKLKKTTKSGGVGKGPSRESCKSGVFCSIKSQSTGSLYHTMCQSAERSVNIALSNCLSWVGSAGPPGQMMICECEPASIF